MTAGRFAPMTRLVQRVTRDKRELRDELTVAQMRVLSLEARLGVARRLHAHALRDNAALRHIIHALMEAAPSDARDLEV